MQLRVPDTIVPGAQVKCPQCSATFAVPQPSAAPPPPPPGHGQFSPAPLPSGGGALGGPALPPPPAREPPEFDYQDAAHRPGGKGIGLAGISPDYTIDLGDYFNSGMSHYGATFGPMIG